MSDTAVVPDSSGRVQVRAFLEFADGLAKNEVLDRDRVSQLIREIAAIDAISAFQARRYGLAATSYGMQRSAAALEQAKAADEHRRLEYEYTDRRALLAAAAKRNELCESSYRETQSDFERERDEAQAEADSPLGWLGQALGSFHSAFSDRTERALQRVTEAVDRLNQAVSEVKRAEAECEAASAQLEQTRDRLRTCDENLTRIQADLVRVSAALVVANLAEHFCAELSLFMRTRAESRIGARELVARLDSPIEGMSNDGPEPMTGRMALERLVTLAENQIR